MSDTDADFHSGHRERLRQKFMNAQLSDAEKLELLLTYVIPRRDVRTLSRQLFNRFGNISGIMTAPLEQLTEFGGLGQNTAIFFKLLNDLFVDGYKYKMSNQPIFYDHKLLENYCLHLLSGKTVEEFHVLYLDSNMMLLADETNSVGTVDSSGVYPREIIVRAIAIKATHVVLLHNHPSGCTTFSESDKIATTRLAVLMRDIGINLYDHFLVANGMLYSAKEIGMYVQ